jgi:L-fuconolactonase
MGGIDAHHHFWRFDPVRDAWIDQSMKAIQLDFMPADIEPLLKAHDLDGTVVVQVDQSQSENDFQLDIADKHEFVKGVVGWVDFRAHDIQEQLNRLSQFKKLKGFRHILQGEKQRDYMLQPDFMRGIGALHAFGYTYDILIFPDQLQFTRQFINSFPYQPFVINHLAKPYIRDQKIEQWKIDINSIAQFENVFCKVSGMVTEADWKQWRHEDFRPYLDVILEAFGPERLMFGSDWPVCLLAASYGDVISIVKEYFFSLSTAEQEAFWGGNARRFYKL